MEPRVDLTLAATAAELVEIAPLVQPSYRGSVLLYAAGLLTVASETWDEAAHNLVEENRSIRRIFVQASAIVADTALRATMAELMAGTDDNLRISALAQSNATLRTALIDVHAAIEQVDGAQARAVEDAIWLELRRSTERRHHSVDLYY